MCTFLNTTGCCWGALCKTIDRAQGSIGSVVEVIVSDVVGDGDDGEDDDGDRDGDGEGEGGGGEDDAILAHDVSAAHRRLFEEW